MKNRCYFERCNAKVASVFESYKIKRDTLEERSFEDSLSFTSYAGGCLPLLLQKKGGIRYDTVWNHYGCPYVPEPAHRSRRKEP